MPMRVQINKALFLGALLSSFCMTGMSNTASYQVALTGDDGTRILHMDRQTVVCNKLFEISSDVNKAAFGEITKYFNDRHARARKESQDKKLDGKMEYMFPSSSGELWAIATQEVNAFKPNELRIVNAQTQQPLFVARKSDDILDVMWGVDDSSVIILKRRFKQHSSSLKGLFAKLIGHPIAINEFYISTVVIGQPTEAVHSVLAGGAFSIGMLKPKLEIAGVTIGCK